MILIAIDGRLAAARVEHQRLMSVAWHGAMLGRMQKPPPLRELLGDATPAQTPTRPKTGDELSAIAAAWANDTRH